MINKPALVFENCGTVTDKQKRIYQALVKKIILHYSAFSNNDYFANLQHIKFSNVKTAEMDAINALAITHETSIQVPLTGFYSADASILSHELAHFYFYWLLHGIDGGRRDSNNFVHYAFNAGFPFVFGTEFRFQSIAEYRAGVHPIIINILYANVGLIMSQADKIRQEIKDHTAPKGVNPYW